MYRWYRSRIDSLRHRRGATMTGITTGAMTGVTTAVAVVIAGNVARTIRMTLLDLVDQAPGVASSLRLVDHRALPQCIDCVHPVPLATG